MTEPHIYKKKIQVGKGNQSHSNIWNIIIDFEYDNHLYHPWVGKTFNKDKSHFSPELVVRNLTEFLS